MKINSFIRALVIKQLAVQNPGFEISIKKAVLTPENNYGRSPLTGITISLRSTKAAVALEKHIDEKKIDDSEGTPEDWEELKEADNMVAELQRAASLTQGENYYH